MILTLLFHPVTLTFVLIFAAWWLQGLITGGRVSHSVKKTVMAHVKEMAAQNTEKAWEGLSYDLKVALTDQKRLKKGGKMFVGTRRVADFSARHSAIYNKANLVIESMTRLRRVKAPKQMYVVRLRSRVTGTIRLTVWVSYVPKRADQWGIKDVCVHPPSGDLGKGESLTGAKISPPKTGKKPSDNSGKKSKKSKKKRRSIKEEAA